MNYLKITATTMLAFLGFGELQAQETVTTSGGNTAGTGGSSSYSVGQVVYTTNTGTNSSVAQGVQQPYEISISVGIEVTEINLALNAYPNPANNALTLHVEDYSTGKLTYQLFDLNGKLLATELVVNTATTVNMQGYPVSIYLLKVLENNSLIKTFRIVKN